MLDKVKLLFILIILGYLGYAGWNVFKGRSFSPKFSESFSEEELQSMTEEEEEAYAADIEKMSPPQRARYELNQVTDRVFAPLSAGERSQTARLKTLWERSQQEFKTGDLTDGNAQTIAELIKMLHGYDQERALFEDRYRNMDHVEDSGLAKGLSAEQKKEFSGNEISRQWKDWVSIHRPKVQRLLSSLSE